MNQDVKSLVSRLETRTRQLMLQYDKLQQLLAETEQKLSEQKRLCLALEEENHSLEEKYARLKMAKLIDMADDDDLKSTRKRINRMIASVDKCLATLKAQ
jgi:phage shock protein A